MFRYGKPVMQETIGDLDAISADEAREAAQTFRHLLKAGRTPKQERQRAHRSRREAKTFAEVTELWIAMREEQPLKPHSRKVAARAVRRLCEVIGEVPIVDVGIDDVLKALKHATKTSRSAINIVRSHMQSVIDFATVRGWRNDPHGRQLENPARSALMKVAGLPPRPLSINRKALFWADLPDFMATLAKVQDAPFPGWKSRDAVFTRRAVIPYRSFALSLMLLVLTGVRKMNACMARREDFDLARRL